MTTHKQLDEALLIACGCSSKTAAIVMDEIANLRAEIERLRLQLAACGVAAHCNTRTSIERNQIKRDNPAWSASYRDVCDAVEREMRLRQRLATARQALVLALGAFTNNNCIDWNEIEQALAAIDATACVCGETSARNCPKHGNE